MEKIELFGIYIDNMDLNEAAGVIKDCVKAGKKMYVVTPNTDHMVQLAKNPEFLEAYQKAGLVAVDGTPVFAAAKLLGTPLKEKITGPRLADMILKMAEKEGFTVFFLGGAAGVAEMAGKRMQEKFPGLKVAGSYSPPFGFEQNPLEKEKCILEINRKKPDIVSAGMGSPKTEIFLMESYRRMDAKVSLSVGAVIDFMAGRVKRCPAWVNRIGMEWFYRFLKEPKRLFKRYFVDDPYFALMVLEEKKKRAEKKRRKGGT